MTKQTKGIIVAVLVLGIAGGMYFVLNKKTNIPSSLKNLQDLQDKVWGYMVSVIPEISSFKSSYVNTDAFKDAAYLKAWSDAIDNSAITFVYNNVTYNTKDGTGK